MGNLQNHEPEQTTTTYRRLQSGGGIGSDPWVKTAGHIAKEYQVHPVQMMQWKGTIRDRLPELCDAPGGKSQQDHEWVARPHLKIGQLPVGLKESVGDRGSDDASGPGSGGEHRALLCCASLPAPSALYGLSVRRLTVLTPASFPRGLATPQLLLSSTWAILLPESENQMTVFPHRGLPAGRSLGAGRSPHQFTPMSRAHQAAQPRPGERFGVEPEHVVRPGCTPRSAPYRFHREEQSNEPIATTE